MRLNASCRFPTTPPSLAFRRRRSPIRQSTTARAAARYSSTMRDLI